LAGRLRLRRALAAALALALLTRAIPIQEVAEELLERRTRRETGDLRSAVIAGLGALRRRDVHHRRQQLGREVREAIRRAAGQDRLRQRGRQRQRGGERGGAEEGKAH